MSGYTDEQLAAAIRSSSSWRSVLRALGLNSTSAGSLRAARRRADALGLDHAHFTAQRTWSDEDLRVAVAASRSWIEAAGRLGLSPSGSTTNLRGHAARLGIDAAHLSRQTPAPDPCQLAPQEDWLPRAGALLAAAWFQRCGCDVAWPLEPCAYDLLVRHDSSTWRIQVKTTRSRRGATWAVKLTSATRGSGTYDPDDVDHLFVIAADGKHFLIPFRVVAGLKLIHLARYADYEVPTAWPPTGVTAPASSCSPPRTPAPGSS